MKKLLAALLLTAVLATPASALTRQGSPTQSAGILRCAFWLVPGAYCSMEHKIIGGAIMGTAIGTGVGAIAASSGMWLNVGNGALIGLPIGGLAPLVIR